MKLMVCGPDTSGFEFKHCLNLIAGREIFEGDHVSISSNGYALPTTTVTVCESTWIAETSAQRGGVVRLRKPTVTDLRKDALSRLYRVALRPENV